MVLRRHKGKVVGHIIAYTSDKTRSPLGVVVPKRGSYYATNPPKTASTVAVNLYKETGKSHEWIRAGKTKILKRKTAMKLHLV